jgi:chorismate synthase
MRGSEANDALYTENGKILARTNHSGGILGGITNGMPLIVRAAIKPTPSIALPQETVEPSGAAATLRISGRHDPCIVKRAVPVLEACLALCALDALVTAGHVKHAGHTGHTEYAEQTEQAENTKCAG